MKKIVEAINKAKTFLLCMHVDPDGDSVGSASAMASILKKMGKETTIYSPGPIPEIYKFLRHTDEALYEIKNGSGFDCVIALDCGDIERIPPPDKIRSLSKLLINIDHHSDNTRFGDINFTKKSSSTGELIFDLAKQLHVGIDSDIATSIYSAIITDTGSFRHENTSARVFEIASALVKHGADPNGIAMKIYESRTISEFKILGKALEKMELSPDGKIAWIGLTKSDIKESGATNEELNGMADQIRSLKGVEVAFFLKEMDGGKIKINFRSKKKNIQKVAKKLGGGGHPKASGAVIPGDIESAKKKVLNAIKNLWTEL